jgi:hypothetical protein
LVLGKIFQVGEQVDDDVQTEQADEADEVRLQVAADQKAIEQVHSG